MSKGAKKMWPEFNKNGIRNLNNMGTPVDPNGIEDRPCAPDDHRWIDKPHKIVEGKKVFPRECALCGEKDVAEMR